MIYYNMGDKICYIEVRKKVVEARETGDICPKTHLRGRKPALDEAALLEMKAFIDSCPDITLAEMCGKKHSPK